jgi:hypothetical protein
MAVRFLDDGFEYLDPMSGASTAGSVIVFDDGVDTVAPWEDRPGYGQNDLIASDALRWMSYDRERLASIPPPVPQQFMPPRFGYSHEPLTIRDVFNEGMWAPVRRSWMAPTVRTLGRTYDEDTWSGTERNMSTSVNPMM